MAALLLAFSASAEVFSHQSRQTVPPWADLPAATRASLGREGIDGAKYELLCRGQVLTESRPVPEGKSGVHVAAFGIINGSTHRLWDLIENCGRSAPIMPYLQSCRVVRSDRRLPPNKRWEQLDIDFHMMFFSVKEEMTNEDTLEAPNYLRWRQVRGSAKVNEGYFRVISITPETQLVVYDVLADPGSLLPSCVKEWVINSTLPEVITALREHA